MAVPAGGSWIGVKNETLGAGRLTFSGGMRAMMMSYHRRLYTQQRTPIGDDPTRGGGRKLKGLNPRFVMTAV